MSGAREIKGFTWMRLSLAFACLFVFLAARVALAAGSVGERITYYVRLGRVNVGQAEFCHIERIKLGGQEVDVMTFVTRLARFKDLEKIYSDSSNCLPLRIERDILLWPGRERITEEYNQKKNTLVVTKQRGKKNEKLFIQKEGSIHNAILFPYSVRHLPRLDIGWSLEMRLPTQQFLIKLVSIEDVTVPAGTFKAYRFESVPKKFEIWITADERRIPVKLTGSGSLGYTLVMKEYSL